MNNEYIYDIADVCQKLNITSRTLRFYEEKGIIDSTKDGFSNDANIQSNKLIIFLKLLH